MRLPKNVWRLGLLAVVLVLATSSTPAPLAACIDDPECARNCDVMCRWGCEGGCSPGSIDTCEQQCYLQCMGC